MVSAAYHLGQGYPVIRLNLRGAGPSLGKCEGHYHAGKSADLRDAIAAMPTTLKSAGLFIVGVSLGGSIVLKYMAENKGMNNVLGAATVCTPIDLRAAQRRIMEPRNTIYHRHLLRSMKQDARLWAGKNANSVRSVLPAINSVYDFDNLIVAHHNGFEGAEDYYERSSAKPLLGKISKPTLLLHPLTDPWVPAKMYLDLEWREDAALTLVIPSDGGHVGFHEEVSRIPWHDRCIGKFLAAHAGRQLLSA
jgi:predicted alpha/beta-fold hydrolase